MAEFSLKKEDIQISQKVPTTLEEEVKELKVALDAVSKMLFLIRKENEKKDKSILLKKDNNSGAVINKEGIPTNTFYIGYTKTTNYPYILIVNEKGEYVIGDKTFKTLSAAAEYVCGYKIDGFSFWQTIEGVFLKEIYK